MRAAISTFAAIATFAAIMGATLAVAACGGDDDTGPRLDASNSDGAAGGSNSIACGLAGMTCALPGMACCDLPAPSNDYCYGTQIGVCEGGAAMRCDGSEDCMIGDVCCLSGGGGSSCGEGPACTAGGGRIMCHDGAVTGCPGAQQCCDLGPGPTTSPYGACGAVCPQ